MMGISPCIAVGGSPSSTLQTRKNLLFLLSLLKLHEGCPLGLEALHTPPPLPHSLFSPSPPTLPPSPPSPSSSSHTQSSRCSSPCDPFRTRPPSVFHRSPVRSWCHTSNSPFMHFHNMFTVLLTRAYRKKESCQV